MHHAMNQSEAEASPTPPTVDMRVAQPRTNLDDPGPGLRDNGRRVLTYADLHTLGGPIDRREAGRELAMHVTGHMQRFIWSFDGRKFSEAPPLPYIGVHWVRRFGETADFAGDESDTRFVAGVRVWF
jgi:FtsP/CotA-like multicopper oxidase with cupredoxin domain